MGEPGPPLASQLEGLAAGDGPLGSAQQQEAADALLNVLEVGGRVSRLPRRRTGAEIGRAHV